MKKLIFILLFVPFIVSGQIPAPLVDLSKYHDDNRIYEMTDLNFTNITNGTYEFTDFNYKPPHGEQSFSDSAVIIDVDQGVFSKITNASNDLFTVNNTDGITIAGDTITITRAGDYIINASVSFSGSAGDVWEFAVFKNNALASPKMERSTSQTDIGNVGLPFYFEALAVGDDLSLKIANTASGDDPTIVSCSCVIWRLHK